MGQLMIERSADRRLELLIDDDFLDDRCGIERISSDAVALVFAVINRERLPRLWLAISLLQAVEDLVGLVCDLDAGREESLASD